MGLTQHEIRIEKNDVNIFDGEEFLYMEGHNVYDAIDEILKAGGQDNLSAYTHVKLNGDLKSIADLRLMSVREELVVELITKSKGGMA